MRTECFHHGNDLIDFFIPHCQFQKHELVIVNIFRDVIFHFRLENVKDFQPETFSCQRAGPTGITIDNGPGTDFEILFIGYTPHNEKIFRIVFFSCFFDRFLTLQVKCQSSRSDETGFPDQDDLRACGLQALF